jgi:ribosome-associated protein
MPPSSTTPPPSEPAELARRIVDHIADRQGEDVVLLDIRRIAAFTDYFVIATATSPRHMRAVVDTLAKELRGEGVRGHKEGEEDSGWILLDFGAVVVHVFSPNLREQYALEELWREATPVVRIQ